ncbi:hypothetical protein LJ739_13985 [Aestuariibacter halophilus]|uniref:DUF2975 domain-containing protein n=1 Tax=Fluctibacter halophilus TaxID=226011 RepID=A0ABS8G9U5_9ALTE|nr:DUF2975 domain-containing protein [Aestuariibacter halophilus]MCC2617357.1 hypothetical protein [Aestuariibacter halophilus]
MTSLDNLRRISQRIRISLFCVLGLCLAFALYGYAVSGTWWVSIGDGQFDRLWASHPALHTQLALIMVPQLLIVAVGIYRLQRLLQLFAQGHFFAQASMANLKWLAWLAVLGACYGMLWPLLVYPLLDSGDELVIDIAPLTLLMLLCLPVLVHLLSAAGALNRDNNEFV